MAASCTVGEDHAEERRPSSSKAKADMVSDKSKYIGKKYVMILRVFLMAAVLWALYNIDAVDTFVFKLNAWLCRQWIFNSVYFETWFATFCYSLIIPIYPWFVDKLRCLDHYKIQPTVRYVEMSVLSMVKEAIIYMAPLMLLDTFIVKQYHGVVPDIWIQKRASIIQHTRALPAEAPPTYVIVAQLMASLMLYDVIFFSIHLLLHKNSFLYKHIHKHHHDHETVHPHVTNQLTVTERLMLILSANFALKVFRSHPLTRAIFIPLFIGVLVDNHAGYDMPFSMHRLVPGNLVGGAVTHFQHHSTGKRHYQPIFCYLDKALDILSKKKAKL